MGSVDDDGDEETAGDGDKEGRGEEAGEGDPEAEGEATTRTEPDGVEDARGEAAGEEEGSGEYAPGHSGRPVLATHVVVAQQLGVVVFVVFIGRLEDAGVV